MKLQIIAAALALTACGSQATELLLNPGTSRSPNSATIDAAARQFARNFSTLSKGALAAQRAEGRPVPLLTQPISIRFANTAKNPLSRVRGNLTLVFDSTGARTFPTDYRAFLQDVFAEAEPAMNQFFGNAFVAGTVRVRNYDADINDRDAVAGGVYVHDNGSGDREIRFPIYQDGSGYKPEVTALNFIHTLLLAYQGGVTFPNDGWNEGLVRSAVAQVARFPGALPAGLDASLVEGVLVSTYGVGGLYDWYNQPALASPRFIAPNLATQPLPVGGSTGGLYLLRYQMAGSAWQKVAVEYPTFAKEWRDRVFAASATPSLSQMLTAGQQALDALRGSGSRIENQSFSSWVRGQYILDGQLNPGLQLALQPFPIDEGLSGNDFGVFGIQAHVFEVRANGDEILSRDTLYPIYWSPDFTRFFTSAQDDRIDVFQGYGSVAPNFPGGGFSGQPYKVTVDVPSQDRLVRVNLPAGAIATPANPTPKTVFGTVSGLVATTGASFSVRFTRGSQTWTLPVQNGAFGGDLTGAPTLSDLRVEVLRTLNSVTSVLATRWVNRTDARLALQLHVDPVSEQAFTLLPGVSSFVATIQPRRTGAYGALGLDPSEALLARWNALRGRFDLSIDVGNLTPGHAYFARRTTTLNRTVSGFAPTNEPVAIALRPGWNFIGSPFGVGVAWSDVEVLNAANPSQTYEAARGTLLGTDAFAFGRGPNDPASGVPETGILTVANAIPSSSGVYVRCLAPEGVVLLLQPPSGGSGNRAALWPLPARWRASVSLEGSGFTWSTVEIGQAKGATRGLDPRLDSDLPPRLTGGPTLTLEGNLFRNLLSDRSTGQWQLRMDGLVVGNTYTAVFTPDDRAPVLDVQGAGQQWRSDGTIRASFRATSTSQTWSIRSRKL